METLKRLEVVVYLASKNTARLATSRVIIPSQPGFLHRFFEKAGIVWDLYGSEQGNHSLVKSETYSLDAAARLIAEEYRSSGCEAIHMLTNNAPSSYIRKHLKEDHHIPA